MIQENLQQYFLSNSIPYNLQNLLSTAYQTILSKDETIHALQSHITKYKAEHAKQIKSIQILQDKITELSPNSNNTASTFMMPSQFKQFFEDFIKNAFSTALAPLLAYPSAYLTYSRQLIGNVYRSVDQEFKNVAKKAAGIFHLDPNDDENLNTMRLAHLKILQDNWEAILSDLTSKLVNGQSAKKYSNEEIKEMEECQEFKEMILKLIQVCAYMVLQERRWTFVIPQTEKIEQFVKKEQTCIDGWIKEKADVLVLIEGLMREGGQNQKSTVMHQNLKNFVIPYHNEKENEYELIQLRRTSSAEKVPKDYCSEADRLQNNNELPSQQICDSISIEFAGDKKEASNSQQINQWRGVRRSKAQPEISIVEDNCLLSILSPAALPKSRANNSESQRIKCNKLKNSTRHNLISDPSFEEIMNLPNHRKKQAADQLPLKRQASRNKKSNSRKNSIGKIVGQAIESKQNLPRNKQNLSKQIMYKDMIKHKLLDHKTERAKEGKNKEEDRPLRVMHIKKMRQKYLNI